MADASHQKPVVPITGDNEQELFDRLSGSVLMLWTTAPVKRNRYLELFNALEHPEQPDQQGVNVYFTDSGSFNQAARKTPEKSGTYEDHTAEKLHKALYAAKECGEELDTKLRHGLIGKEIADKPIVHMVEDSGWEIVIDDQEQKQAFLRSVEAQVKEFVRPEEDAWLFNHIEESFPGPNLKPFMEHLPGGFPQLMEIIYHAAEEAGLEELRYCNSFHYAFGKVDEDRIYTFNRDSGGKLISHEAFEQLKQNVGPGEQFDVDRLQIPDGQSGGQEKTLFELGEGRYREHSSTLAYQDGRRNMAEWLQAGIGSRQTLAKEREEPLHIAYVSASSLETGEAASGLEAISAQLGGRFSHDVIALPTNEHLRFHPHAHMLNGADIVVLRPEEVERTGEGLLYDPNLLLLDHVAVTTETEPLSMTTPVILDNRDGGFNHALDIIRDAYVRGRYNGLIPFTVATDDQQLETLLETAGQQMQRARIAGYSEDERQKEETRPVPLPPNDGVPAVFVGGGHNNNNAEDRKEAQSLGYMLAASGFRIVTGGGQIDGSMGAVHTGFIQYHLEQLMASPEKMAALSEEMQEALQEYRIQRPDGSFSLDAERLIDEEPKKVESLADLEHIPRNMFFGYSTQALIDLESPSGTQTVAAVFEDTGNRVRRIEGTLSPDAKVILPGGIGTDEEFMHTIRQHIDEVALQRKASNDEAAIAPGQPRSRLIVYNRDQMFDALLQSSGLLNYDGEPVDTVLKRYNIAVADNFADLQREMETEKPRQETLFTLSTERAHQGRVSESQQLGLGAA